jgi:hypothetical protein
MQSESQLRRRARTQGMKLIKYRERSRWYQQYGPYALADERNHIVAWGMGLDAVEAELQT